MTYRNEALSDSYYEQDVKLPVSASSYVPEAYNIMVCICCCIDCTGAAFMMKHQKKETRYTTFAILSVT